MAIQMVRATAAVAAAVAALHRAHEAVAPLHTSPTGRHAWTQRTLGGSTLSIGWLGPHSWGKC
eukprot:scaffold7729_cov120-Isochrysis_galbana.AAC.3